MKEHIPTFLKKYFILLLFLSGAITSSGQDLNLSPVTRTFVIRNVNITQSPGRTIEMGSVLIKNGVIQTVGKSVKVPADARIVEADSMYLYAGFIDGLSHTGLPKPKEEEGRRGRDNKVMDPGNPSNEIAGIQPGADVRMFLDPSDKSIADMRELGFTAAQVVPYGKMLPGKGSIILLAGDATDPMIYRSNTALFSQLEGAAGVYPSTSMAVMAKYRQLYRQAEQSKLYKSRYEKEVAGMERPSSNRVLEAFYPVIDRNIPVVFKAETVLDIQKALTLKKDLGFDLVLGEVKQGWDVTEKIKSSGAKVFLSLDLPEMKDEKEEADSLKSDTTEIEKKKEVAESEERRLLDERKKQMIMNYYTQPTLFNEKGIDFGFSTLEAKSKDIRTTLNKLVENGLTEDAALASLTTVPAQLLGLSAVMGSVDNGKIANLVITDKPYFSKDSRVRYVFVDGRMFKYEDKPKKKAKNGGEAVNIEGKWSYSTETPQGNGTGTITVTGAPGSYEGALTSSFSSDTNDLNDILVDGNQWSFSFTIVVQGNTMNVEVLLTLEGDTFEGTMTAGEYGSFPIEGERIPE